MVAAAQRISPMVLDPSERNNSVNLVQNVYKYFQDEENPDLIKIGLVALGAFAVLAVGYAFGSMLLTAAIACTVVVLTASFEANRLQQEADLKTLRRQIASLEVVDTIVGTKRFLEGRLPVLDLGERESDTGDINFIHLNEVLGPKRGVDKYGRHFYAFQIESRADHSRHVFVLFEKYTNSDVWHISGPQNFLQSPFNDAAKEAMNRLLFERDHPDYSLVMEAEPLEDQNDVGDVDGQDDAQGDPPNGEFVHLDGQED